MSEFLYQLLSGIGILSILNIQIKKPISYFYFFGLAPLLLLLVFTQDSGDTKDLSKEKIGIRTILPQIEIISSEFVIWLFGGLFFRFILQSIDLGNSTFSYKTIMNVWILSNVSSMIGSYLLGGLGMLREFTLVLLLNDYFSSSVALIIVGLVRLSLTIFGVLWASANYFLILMIIKIRHRIIR